jgi:MFS family permease
MANVLTDKKQLQRVVVVCSFIPILVGLDGVLLGARMLGGTFGSGVSLGVDNQFRYLSGVFLAIGISYLSSVRKIEQHGERLRLLAALVVAGGIARLVGVTITGLHSIFTILIIAAELVIAPCLCLWQSRVARRVLETDFLSRQ